MNAPLKDLMIAAQRQLDQAEKHAAQRIEEGGLHPDDPLVAYARQAGRFVAQGASALDQLGAEFEALRARIFGADTY
jgi:hypothetical protein